MTLCTPRVRSEYCPNGDGSFKFPYTVELLAQYNRVDFNPLSYLTITGGTTVTRGFSTDGLPVHSGVALEPIVEAAVSWWRPLADFNTIRYANSNGSIGSGPADDTTGQFINRIDTVAMQLKITMTGTRHQLFGQLRSSGATYILHTNSETSTPLTFEFTMDWIGGPPPGTFGGPSLYQILVPYILDVATFAYQDREECFEVNPVYDNTRQIGSGGSFTDNLGHLSLISSPSQQSSFVLGAFSGAGDANVTLNATVFDSITIAPSFGYYVYSHWHYTCCDGLCPPCSTPVPIPAGATLDVCVSSQAVDCDTLPMAGAITGPSPFAGECTLGRYVNCKVAVTAPCLTQAQIDAGGYQGPYTVTMPGTRHCHQGGSDKCELLVGTFTIVSGRVCDETPPGVANPFNLQDHQGRYHATAGGGGGVGYLRSDFGTPKDLGWAVNTTLTAPTGKAQFDPRVVVDQRGTVILCYAQQKISDSTWDGVYLRRSNDDGRTWEDPVLAIAGGKHPTLAIGQDGVFDTVVVAAYTGSDAGPGTITARVQHAGDEALGDPFIFKDGSSVNLSVENDTFHIQQARDDQSRWMLHVRIHGAGTSHWTSYDECQTWEQVA